MKPFLIILALLLTGYPVLCQRVLIQTCVDLRECPPNYPVQILDAKTNIAILSGFNSNWTWTAYYAALPSFDAAWSNWQATNQSSATFSTRTNMSGLLLRQTLLLSNVNWFATNMSVLNATLGSSNLIILRYVEERIKAGQ